MSLAKCKICRRAGQKLFLKGERCFSPKCAIVRRNYPPGVHGQTMRRKTASEFGQELAEKQKIQHAYHLSERQFSSYVKYAIHRAQSGMLGGKAIGDSICEKLEFRLDNAVFRSGFTVSRSIARHLVSHGHFTVNGRKVDIPSFMVKIGDKISVRPESLKLAPFSDLKNAFAQAHPPAWLRLDPVTFTSEVIGLPNQKEAALIGDLSKVIEYYSR